MLLVLQAVVAWVLKKGIDKKGELIAELRKSKLGEGFAKSVELLTGQGPPGMGWQQIQLAHQGAGRCSSAGA
jgi:hypothetical protein